MDTQHSPYHILHIEDHSQYSDWLKKKITAYKIEGKDIIYHSVTNGIDGLKLLQDDVNWNFIKVVICDWRLLEENQEDLQLYQGPTLAGFIASMTNHVSIYLLTNKRAGLSKTLTKKELPPLSLFDKQEIDENNIVKTDNFCKQIITDLTQLEEIICSFPNTKPWEDHMGPTHKYFRSADDYREIDSSIEKNADIFYDKLLKNDSLNLNEKPKKQLKLTKKLTKGNIESEKEQYIFNRALREVILKLTFYNHTKEIEALDSEYQTVSKGFLRDDYNKIGLKNSLDLFYLLPEERNRLTPQTEYIKQTKINTYKILISGENNDSLKAWIKTQFNEFDTIKFITEEEEDVNGVFILLKPIQEQKQGIQITVQLRLINKMRFDKKYRGPFFILSSNTKQEIKAHIKRDENKIDPSFLKIPLGYHFITTPNDNFDTEAKTLVNKCISDINNMRELWPPFWHEKHIHPLVYQIPKLALWDYNIFFNSKRPIGIIQEIMHNAKLEKNENKENHAKRLEASFDDFPIENIDKKKLKEILMKNLDLYREDPQIDEKKLNDRLYKDFNDLQTIKSEAVNNTHINVYLLNQKKINTGLLSLFKANNITLIEKNSAKEIISELNLDTNSLQTKDNNAIKIVLGYETELNDFILLMNDCNHILSFFLIGNKKPAYIIKIKKDKEMPLIHYYTKIEIKELVEDIRFEHEENEKATSALNNISPSLWNDKALLRDLYKKGDDDKLVKVEKENIDKYKTKYIYIKERKKNSFWITEKNINNMVEFLFQTYLQNSKLFLRYNKVIPEYSDNNIKDNFLIIRIFRLLLIKCIESKNDKHEIKEFITGDGENTFHSLIFNEKNKTNPGKASPMNNSQKVFGNQTYYSVFGFSKKELIAFHERNQNNSFPYLYEEILLLKK